MLIGKSLFIRILAQGFLGETDRNSVQGAHLGLGKHMVTLSASHIADYLKVSSLRPWGLAAGS